MIKVLSMMIGICFHSFAFGQSYNASYADKYGAKHGVYHAQPANQKVKGLVKADELKQPGLAEYYTRSNFDYNCPGYSFVIGIKSSFERYHGAVDEAKHRADRDFAFICGFLEDKKDRLIRKTSCVSPSEADNKRSENGVSRCSKAEQFVQGLSSKRYMKDEDNIEYSFHNDRINRTSCCELKDFDGNTLTATSCMKQSYAAKQNFEFTCPNGKILKEIKTTFHDEGGLWDRNYSFTCCNATFEE